MDSEDSDFYGIVPPSPPTLALQRHFADKRTGDEDVVADLEARVDDFDTETWLAHHDLHPGRPRPRTTLPTSSASLHNPYAGVPFAWQLTETVEAFLTRLPPRTTEQTPETPWVFICNPYIARTAKGQDQAENAEKGRGNEDEGPGEEGSKVGLVVEAGLERLEILAKFVEKTKALAKNKTAAEKEMNQERKQAVSDILALAHAAKVRPGKVRDPILEHIYVRPNLLTL